MQVSAFRFFNNGLIVKKLVMEQGYTAVFVVNDWMAVGLLQRLKENGVSVPEQVSIISVDNISMSGQISPGLTTYSLDMSLLIAEVFSLLSSFHNGVDTPVHCKRVALLPVLITRETLKKSRNSLVSNP